MDLLPMSPVLMWELWSLCKRLKSYITTRGTMNISIFGTGYVGLVTGACLANIGHAVCCMDVDVQKIELLKQGKLQFYEPGLKELVAQNQKRLHFTTNMEEAVCF